LTSIGVAAADEVAGEADEDAEDGAAVMAAFGGGQRIGGTGGAWQRTRRGYDDLNGSGNTSAHASGERTIPTT
jgi:hypothetical protein